MVVNPDTDEERRLGGTDTAVLQPGDVLQVRSAGGGGRGDPMNREPWRVARDVARGYVSAEAARRDYGVVLKADDVDAAATEALRAKLARHQEHFHFGPEREGYERQWTEAAYARLTEILAALPVHWRFFVKTEIFRRIGARSGAEGVEAAFSETCARFPDLPHPTLAIEAPE
jgi:N-methylhydantoinase B